MLKGTWVLSQQDGGGRDALLRGPPGLISNAAGLAHRFWRRIFHSQGRSLFLAVTINFCNLSGAAGPDLGVKEYGRATASILGGKGRYCSITSLIFGVGMILKIC